MLTADIASRRRERSPPIAAAFSPALIDPEQETPAVVTGPNGKARGQALQRLSQQRHGQPDRRAGGDLSGGAAHHRRGVLSRHGALSCPRHAAELAAAVRIRPRLSGFHRADTNTLDRCRGSPTRRGIERAWLDAYHAADASPLAPSLGRVPPERLGRGSSSRLIRRRGSSVRNIRR